MKRVAINGFGRIGRLVVRVIENEPDMEVVAINDLFDPEQLSFLLKYDTAQGKFMTDQISYDEKNVIIKGRKIPVFAEKDPINLPWKELNVDLVFECTGHFTKLDDAMSHIKAGAKKVIISAPSKGDMKTIVYNVNSSILDGSEEVISTASCTTNCLAPVLKVLMDNFGIEKGYMTTTHAVTNTQPILDAADKSGISKRRERGGAFNIVPTTTGAAEAIGLVIPELKGKMDGKALRVPVPTGSIIDLTLELQNKTSVQEINEVLKNNANETLNYTDDPIVSSDIVGSSCGALVDGSLTDIIEINDRQLAKVWAWYDNEYGYTSQMVRTAKYWLDI